MNFICKCNFSKKLIAKVLATVRLRILHASLSRVKRFPLRYKDIRAELFRIKFHIGKIVCILQQFVANLQGIDLILKI